MDDKQVLQQSIEKSPQKKSSLKWKVYLIIFSIILVASAYGYFWVQQTNTLRIEAGQVVGRAEQFDTLQATIFKERTRCEQFILQQEGDFSSFEYCKKFIDWADTLSLTK